MKPQKKKEKIFDLAEDNLDFDETPLNPGHFKPIKNPENKILNFKSMNNKINDESSDFSKLSMSNSFLSRVNQSDKNFKKRDINEIMGKRFKSSFKKINNNYNSKKINVFNKPRKLNNFEINKKNNNSESSESSNSETESENNLNFENNKNIFNKIKKNIKSVYCFFIEFFKYIGCIGTFLYFGFIFIFFERIEIFVYHYIK